MGCELSLSTLQCMAISRERQAPDSCITKLFQKSITHNLIKSIFFNCIKVNEHLCVPHSPCQ